MHFVGDSLNHYMSIRFPWFLKREEIKQAKTTVRLLILLRHYIHKKIPEEVRVHHKITKAISHLAKVKNEAEKMEKADFEGAESVEFQEIEAIKLISKIEDQLVKHGSTIPDRIKEKLSVSIQREFEEELSKDRELYRLLQAARANTKGHVRDATLMLKILRSMKTDDISRFAALALRFEARYTWNAFKDLRRDKQQISRAMILLERDKTKGITQLENILQGLVPTMHKLFQNAYTMLKRDLLAALLVLKYIDEDTINVKKFIEEHVMPVMPGEKHLKYMGMVKTHIEEHVQTLAQGLRKIVSMTSEQETKIKRIPKAQSK